MYNYNPIMESEMDKELDDARIKTVKNIVELLKAKKYKVDKPILMQQAVRHDLINSHWISAINDKNNELMILIVNSLGKFYELRVGNYIYSVSNGFSDRELSSLAIRFINSRHTVQSEEQKHGIGPSYHLIEHSTWHFDDGKRLQLVTAEDERYRVMPNEVQDLLIN